MRFSLLLMLGLWLAQPASAQRTEPATVRIGVLLLFHPRTLILTSRQGLTLTLDGRTLNLAPDKSATLAVRDGGLTLTLGDNPPLETQTLFAPSTAFTLTVPGKLTRAYLGALTLTSTHGQLVPIIVMPVESAVASIVQAESPPHASLEALKAQAVVSRSYLLANLGSHLTYDSCDTTHCQFLRSPPPPGSADALATRATAGIVLTWRPSPESPLLIVPAMYARSCGGHTRAHPSGPGTYPFYPVACSFCLRHPERWQRELASSAPPQSEQQRLAWNRSHGWSAIPSNSYSNISGHLSGRGNGHGVGLCQLGAADMAAHGASYEKIVAHFFPNTTLSHLVSAPKQ
jgi:stage II sporulation protein D